MFIALLFAFLTGAWLVYLGYQTDRPLLFAIGVFILLFIVFPTMAFTCM